jgi:four helix bundle protein
MDENEMKQRTKSLSLRCIKLAESLPSRGPGRIISDQLTRAGSSVGSNDRAACRGRSRAEFLAKLGNVEEEADETAFWMEMIMDSGLKPERLVAPLHREAEEILRIIVASIKSARARAAIQNPKSKIQNG